MSKLSLVRRALEANPEVIVVRAVENNYLPERDGFWSHTVDFYVAPRRGLYTADELQAFMMGLVPKRLEPTMMDCFSQADKCYKLQLGKLYFDEVIGGEKITRVCTITDEEMLNASGFMGGQRTIEESIPYKRRTWVSPFPCESAIKDLFNRRLSSEFGINPEELDRYRREAVQSA